jgi:outer membrane protein
MLADELKAKRQIQVDNANKYVQYLQTKYFGFEGEIFKQREKLVRPIQNEIYNATQQLALKNGWDFILDKSAGTGLLYSDPKLNKSDLVLQALGVTEK